MKAYMAYESYAVYSPLHLKPKLKPSTDSVQDYLNWAGLLAAPNLDH
jgi:hypothetical protein